MSLVVPIVTMSKIEKEEVENLTAAVRGGVGLAGYHGGMCDAFRESVDYQFMCGGQWVAHPGNVIDYSVDVVKPDDPIMQGVSRFPLPVRAILHARRSLERGARDDRPSRANTPRGSRVSRLPVVWKRKHGGGARLLQLAWPCLGRVQRPRNADHPREGHALGGAMTPAIARKLTVTTIRNPILPGFNPDPSICRVGADYYIATSTFEWYPGVQIHHSRDLVNWRLVRRPLERAAQLDLRGDPDSCGVWAPCLSHADGRFWLVYTDVKRPRRQFQGRAQTISSPRRRSRRRWSDPSYVNSSGFDPSLFHDDDGRKWFVNMIWNHRDTPVDLKHPAFLGIVPAGMGRGHAETDRRPKNDLRRQRAWPGRGTASLQARRLVLSDDRRGRHGLRPCGDNGAGPTDRWAL